MFNNNKLRRYLLLAIFPITCLSCGKDFLNPTIPGTLIRQDYVTNLSTTKEYLLGVYNSLTPVLGGITALYPDIVADNIKPVTGATILTRQYSWTQEAGDLSSNDQNLNQLYLNLYKAIFNCNFVLECTMKFKNENEQQANSLKGQALAIRSMMYYMLVNYFAQPYVFTSDASHIGVAINNSTDWSVYPPKRNSVREVYDLMEKDLKESIELLPATSGNVLFVGQNAAKSMLARVLLARENFQGARYLARDVSQRVPIMTSGYPAKLFTPQESEAIFQVDQIVATPVTLASYYFRSVIQFTATDEIAALLTENPNDARRAWVSKTASGWNIVKYPQSVIPAITLAANSYYHTVIRSSEMYLVAAEAYARSGSTYADSARFYLNKIRKRADPAIADVTATGQPLLDSIYKERRKELAFEGFRLMDLYRIKLGVTRKEIADPALKNLPFGSNKGVCPIPVRDVKIAGYEQNLGY